MLVQMDRKVYYSIRHPEPIPLLVGLVEGQTHPKAKGSGREGYSLTGLLLKCLFHRVAYCYITLPIVFKTLPDRRCSQNILKHRCPTAKKIQWGEGSEDANLDLDLGLDRPHRSLDDIK